MAAPSNSKPSRQDASAGADVGERLHVAIVGFAGAGKTSVGSAVAQATGLGFIDLEAAIAKAANKPVADILREHGEVAFRARERAALREVLASPKPIILATGGGTFVDPAMRAAICKVARTVYLKTGAETLLARRSGGDGRPAQKLPPGPDPLATLQRQLDAASEAYDECDLTVQTDGRSLDDVTAEIVKTLRIDRGSMRRDRAARKAAAEARTVVGSSGSGPLLRVQHQSGEYPIELRAEAGPWLAEAIARVCPGSKVAVISDTHVAPLHGEPLLAALKAQGKTVTLHTFAAGEDSKVLATAAHLYDELLDARLSRGDALVALGGGVVGDMTGFVASTLLRGIPFVQVPTTTLAAVDSSVGGKTGINTSRGKNLVGTFYPPQAVLIAAQHLATQERRAHAAGLVEALKMAATMDADLFDAIAESAPKLLAYDPDVLLNTIAQAVGLKADVVARDERELGERAVLNYGHTIGHAIESGEQYRLPHGEAVALGMMAEAQWADLEGLSQHVAKQLEAGLQALGAPTEWLKYRCDLDAMGLDKKRLGAAVRLPVVRELGSFELRSVPLAALAEYVSRRKNSP